MMIQSDDTRPAFETAPGRALPLRRLIPFMLVVVFLAFFRTGSVKLFDYDEAIYAESAKEMLQTGNWLNPTYTGENFYDKPVLYYWLEVFSYKALGVNERAARLPSSVFGVLLVLVFLFVMNKVWGYKRAFYAASAIAFSLFFSVYSRACLMDMTLTFFVACAVLSFYLSLNQRNPYIYGLYAFSGLAFLTKGPIGIVFCFAICGVYQFIKERWSGVRKLFSPGGLSLLLLIAAPWFVAQIVVNGREFFNQFIIAQHVRRFTGAMQGHKGPLYYYLPVLLLGGFPWIAYFPAGLIRAFNDRTARDLGLLALIWCVLITLFFSLAKTKLPNYILPAFPAVIIIAACGLGSDAGSMGGRMKRLFAACRKGAHIAIISLSLLIGAALLFVPAYAARLGVEREVWPYMAAAALLAVAGVTAAAMLQKRDHPVLMGLFMAVFLLTLSSGATRQASLYLQGTLHRYSLYMKHEAPPASRIVSYRLSKPSLVFYSGRFVERVWGEEELGAYLRKTRPRGGGCPIVAVTKAEDIKTLQDFGFRLVDTDGTYGLLKIP